MELIKTKVWKLAGLIIVGIICALFLCACGNQEVKYDPEDYILSLEYKDDFRILQLSDIHMANKDNRQYHYDFLDLTINDADADMIILNGDLFTFADKKVALELFQFIDSHGIPWTVTFGNHDEQCYFPIDWMTGVLNDYGSNCIFKDIQDDDVYGNCNFAINLLDGDKIVEQLIVIDSNRYNYGEYFGYDYIKPDQIEWYENLVNYTADKNGGKVVPSMAFFHIPLPEIDEAWDAVETGEAELVCGEKREKSCPPLHNSGMFDKMMDLGSTNALCFAHDHVNDFVVKYKGIYMSYGVNSTDRIYYDDAIIGGRVMVVHGDGSLDFESIYHTYEEVAR